MARLKREVEELRNASHHSFSSTPSSAQSYASDRGSFMDPAHLQVFNELLKVCSTSFCEYIMQLQLQLVIVIIIRITIMTDGWSPMADQPGYSDCNIIKVQ